MNCKETIIVLINKIIPDQKDELMRVKCFKGIQLFILFYI